EYSVEEVSPAALNTLLLESGGPRYGSDFGETIVIAETPFEAAAVSYEKGCYPGQEVVARLKAYGTPKQALAGLVCEAEGPDLPPPGAELFADGKRAGRLCGYASSPALAAWSMRAYLDRAHRTQDQELALTDADGGHAFMARVRHLPIIE